MKQFYSTCVTDEQWDFIKDFFPAANDVGRPREIAPRSIVNAILYLLKTGIQWRLMPNEFPKWKTVHHYFTEAGEKMGFGKRFMSRYGRRNESAKDVKVNRRQAVWIRKA